MEGGIEGEAGQCKRGVLSGVSQSEYRPAAGMLDWHVQWQPAERVTLDTPPSSPATEPVMTAYVNVPAAWYNRAKDTIAYDIKPDDACTHWWVQPCDMRRGFPPGHRLHGRGTHGRMARCGTVADYTFYILESDGYLVGATAINCADDAAALDRANELLGTFNAAVEVWQASRKIGHVGVPRGVSDKPSDDGLSANSGQRKHHGLS
jgi:hypothetical protein